MGHKRELSEIAYGVQVCTQSYPVPCFFLTPWETIPRDTGELRCNQSNAYDYDKCQTFLQKKILPFEM